MVRMKEKRREKAALAFAQKNLGLTDPTKISLKSSWGPYTSTDGTAKKTGVPGLTSPVGLVGASSGKAEKSDD